MHRVPVAPLADQLGNGFAAIVAPAGHSYGEEVAQPVQGVLTDGGVVSIGERVGQVPQATRVNEKPGLHGNPMDQRMFADDVGDP
ncbi:hypothetical protein [Micromonospora sicca]|uniref:hypothetical protein n=1 Tax=Micromonospora TaxID=1873 RepID=UPI0034CD682F